MGSLSMAFHLLLHSTGVLFEPTMSAMVTQLSVLCNFKSDDLRNLSESLSQEEEEEEEEDSAAKCETSSCS